jgi:UDP-2,3-diacylglucosamine hydrolase
MKEIVGLIAGDGKLPLLLASSLRSGSRPVVAIGHRGATETNLKAMVNTLHWVNIGELGKIIDLLKEEGVKKALFAGGIPKTLFFSEAKPDGRAIQVLSRLKDKKDDAILRAIAQEVESEGIRVVSPIPFLKDAMAPRGCWSGRKPTEREEKDMAFGWRIAKRVGRLDIGQCVVVKEQMVLAVEAIEGTNETIRRGGTLGRGDVMVIKICKPRQDRRLDLPVIGPLTVTTLQEAGASALVVEAGKTIVVDKEEVIHQADQDQICLIGM